MGTRSAGFLVPGRLAVRIGYNERMQIDACHE